MEPNSFKIPTGREIKAMRALVDMEQQELAAESRVPGATISRYENGNTSVGIGSVSLMLEALQNAYKEIPTEP